MNGRTRRYLKGRFQDYYRDAELTPPPAATQREWGFIPWDNPNQMIRHQSLLSYSSPKDLFLDHTPRHAYFSAAQYTAPDEPMNEKGWQGTDLVFDIDADHLRAVDEHSDSHQEMLAACKDTTRRLLNFLRDDFGFDDEELMLVFSGRRGYHVHVRDDSVFTMDSDAREHLVEYVRGIGIDYGSVTDNDSGEQVFADGGWPRRIHESLLEDLSELRSMNKDAAVEQLMNYDNIGQRRAERIYAAATDHLSRVKQGEVNVNNAFNQYLQQRLRSYVEQHVAEIDDPVTTDTRRLIRAPGSLHGGAGLLVQRVPLSEFEDYRPLADAVPEQFTETAVRTEVTDPGTVTLGGQSYTVERGSTSVNEAVGIYLMARGRAEKASPPSS